MPPQPTHSHVSPEEVIKNYYLRHPFEDTDNSLYGSAQLSRIIRYEPTRRPHILLNKCTIEARGNEMNELLNRVGTEQLLKKRLDELQEQGIPAAEMHQIFEKLQLDPVTSTPRSRITDSQLVTPRTVMRECVSDEESAVSIPSTTLEGSPSQGVEDSAMIEFRENAKAYFIAGGWTEEDFNHLVGDQALRELTADGQVESETEMLRRLIAVALGEQVNNIIPEAVEDVGSGHILDNGCPFHVVRAYISTGTKRNTRRRRGRF